MCISQWNSLPSHWMPLEPKNGVALLPKPIIASQCGQIQRVMNGLLTGMYGISWLGPWKVSTGLSCSPWCRHLVIAGGTMPGIMDVYMTGGKNHDSLSLKETFHSKREEVELIVGVCDLHAEL